MGGATGSRFPARVSALGAGGLKYLLIALASAVLAVLAVQSAAIGALEEFFQDVRVGRLSAPAAMDRRILVVAVSETTLDRFAARSPVDRAFLADLVTRIDSGAPKAIGLDVLLDRRTTEPADTALRQALSAAAARVVVVGPAPASRNDTPFFRQMTAGLQIASSDIALSRRDQVVRVQTPRDTPNLAAALAQKAGAAAASRSLVIPFFPGRDGARYPFLVLPAEDVADGAIEPSLFADRIVLIGGALDRIDRFATPLRFAENPDQTTPGVVVHAYQVRQLLEGARNPQAPPVWTWVLAFLGSCIGAAIAASAWRWGTILAAIGAGVTAWLLIAFGVFAVFGLLLPVVAPMLAFVVAVVGAGAATGAENRRKRREIDRAFRHYLDPNVVDKLMAKPGQLALDGELRDVTVLFTDLEGFTRFIEGSGDLRAASAVLNAYFDRLLDVAVSYGGMVDKIVGDAIIVIFGAPRDDEGHAAAAIACALAMSTASEDFRRSAPKGFGRTRIGLHSGEAVVGSFGGSKRFDYTVYGMVINLTSRLEPANKVFGTNIIASRAVIERAVFPPAREIGKVLLRGSAEPLEIWEPIAPNVDAAAYAAALTALRRGDRAPMAALAAADPADGLAASMAHQTGPAGADAVFNLAG